MALPKFNGTYTNECEVNQVDFLIKIKAFVDGGGVPEYRTFLHGLSYYCRAFESKLLPLMRCGGCQLVAYCSRDCQKNDRSTHKYVCKEFPVSNGKNVLYTKGPWNDHIARLEKRVLCLPNAEFAARLLFRNPRVCHTCREARHDHLKTCKCAFISYCSQKCAKADKKNHTICDYIWDAARSYSLDNMQHLPSMRDETICTKYKPIKEYWDVVPDSLREKDVSFQLLQAIEALSFPMSLIFALHQLPGRRLGPSVDKLEDISTLTIHVVTSSPPLDSEPWEVFMHRLPRLKKLNVVFIMQGRPFRWSFGLNKRLSLLRCKDCKAKNRLITYHVQQTFYHMYFSSADYIKPDVVVIYGNTHEMLGKKDLVHSEISYRNMLHSRNTILLLMDLSFDAVINGLNFVNAAQPVIQIVPIFENLLRGHGLNLVEMELCETDEESINEKKFTACVKRK